MSQKLHSKLLSIILCIAICCATLCGSIIAAHAAAADYNGTYTISVGDDKQAVPYAATEVKVQVKFDLPAGFVGGQFTANAESTYTIGDTAEAVAITTKDGSDFDLADVEVKKANGSDKFRFVIGDGSTLCTSITIEYTILMSSYVSNGTTTKYPVSITLDEDDLVQFATYDLQDVTFTASADSDSWFHSHSSWYATNGVVLDAEKNGKHTVIVGNARCHWCTTPVANGGLALNDNYIPQVLPDYTEFDGVTTPLFPSDDTDGDAHTAWIGISGVTVSYNDNGTLDVDVHVYSQYRTSSTGDDKVILFVCDEEGNELYRMSPVKNGSSYYAGNGLHADEKMFTITGLSARDIEKNLLLTAIEYSTGVIEHSRTVTFNLADYCENVVTGESTVWAEGATDAQIEADKDIAAALYYYGAAIHESVFDKNTSSGSSIEYVNANYDEWDGTFSQPTTTDADSNIIINTAEELAWVALSSGTATAGNNYKVAANSVFNLMGMDGITLSSTAAQVKAAGDARTADTYNYTKAWRAVIVEKESENAFQGNFDGNGLIVYNLYSAKGRGYSGLFPYAKPATADTPQVIKNVAVYASHIGGYHYAGGIAGLVECNTTSSTVNFDSCVVKNSYIYDNNDTTAAPDKTVGTIVGGLSHNGFTLNNCAAIDNQISGQGVTGGLAGNKSEYGGSITITNSLSIGTSVKPTAGTKTPSAKFDSATITNVYTEDVAAATLGSDWFDTTTYPELSIFHVLSKQYVDDSTHKVICVLKAGDNTCGLEGLTEEHTLVKNDEGTAKVCECGYSVPIYKEIEYITANYDEWDGTKVEPTETDSEGNIIIRNAEQLAWIALQGGDTTKNTNYKVAANSVFNLMGMEGITLNSTAAQVKSATKDTTRNWVSNNVFYGNFDGNGLIVYNACGDGKGEYQYSGLFPRTNKTANGDNTTIKNVMVRSSYFTGYNFIGGVVGVVDAVGASSTATIDNCAVVNCYMSDNNNSNTATERTVSTIAGGVSHNKTTLTNCIALNNELASSNIQGGLFGDTSAYASAGSISNSIVIGSSLKPEDLMTTDAKGIETAMSNTTYTNVHTADVAAATLGSAWFDTDSYPELSIFHEMTEEFVDETTHKPICIIEANGVLCTVCGVAEEHTLTKNDEKSTMECACGYYEDIIGNSINPNNKTVVYWGTNYNANRPATHDAAGFTTGSGTSNDPYIVETVAQLWYVAQKSGSGSADTYYKVADGIAAFDISPDGSGWNLGDNSLRFQGHFDGNGVEIRGLNFGADGAYHAGLFPNVTGTVSISNIKIVDGEIKASSGVAGAIVANVNGTANVTISNCAVVNSTVSSLGTGDSPVGAIVGHGGNGAYVTVNNCFVSNTTVTTNSTSASYPSNAVLGVSWTPANCTISNSIVLGCNPENKFSNISNVYTDYASVTNSNITKVTDLNTLKGSGVVKNLDLDSDIWFDTDSYPELHVFHDMKTVYIDGNTHQYVCQHFINGTQCTTCQSATTHTMVDAEDGLSASCECGYSYEIKGIHAMGLPESILEQITKNDTYIKRFATNALFKNAYNADVFGTDVTIENVFDMYTTSLNLKVNPHIGFMFAFHGDYKTNRSNITVTFTVDGETYTTAAVETDGTLGTNWVNNSGAGRYHLYRFKELPVSKLCKDINVTVNYGGNAYDFGTYSAAGYAINAMNAGEDYQYHVNASMALVYYSEMLAARASV